MLDPHVLGSLDPRAPWRTAVLAAVVLALAACGSGDATADDRAGTASEAPAPGEGPPDVAAPQPAPTREMLMVVGATAEKVRTEGEPLGVGDLRAVGLSGAWPSDVVDGSRPLAFTSVAALFAEPVDESSPIELLWLAAPEGSTFDVLADGSLLVRDGDGVADAGVSPPDGPPGVAVRWEVPEPGLAVLGLSGHLPDAAPLPEDGDLSSARTVDVVLSVSDRALASAEWRVQEGGQSLAVAPTTWAREAGLAGEAVLTAQLAETTPEAVTGTMQDQLRCHAVGAPDKATWNLEPWRPDVGLPAVLAAGCNPA